MYDVLDSDNSPIIVNYIQTPYSGLLGMTFAPGKKFGYWNRDLDKDLIDLKNVYEVDVLVCLIEDHEFIMLDIPGLIQTAIHKYGIQTLHFPIQDGYTHDNQENFLDLINNIMSFMKEGKNVVIHCRGGLGRTGYVAACCLKTLGISSDDAIRIVHDVRKGTIENFLQEHAVREF